MTISNDGGPAFPHLRSECQRVNDTEMYEGLSIRDYFAGQALAGLFADPDTLKTGGTDIAKCCYKFADAMLAARGGA